MIKAVLSKKDLTKQEDYYSCVSDLLCDRNILKLDEFTHHHITTRLQHSLNVSYYNYKLCRLLRLNARSAARAGLFHDLFYYETGRQRRANSCGRHNSLHPRIAFNNASEMFPITELEGDMIANHMWPMTLHIPRHRETFVIVLVDKFCAVAEVLAHAYRKGRVKLKVAQAFSLMLLIKLLHR